MRFLIKPLIIASPEIFGVLAMIFCLGAMIGIKRCAGWSVSALILAVVGTVVSGVI